MQLHPRLQDQLQRFLSNAEDAGVLRDIEQKVEGDRDKKRAELAAKLAALPTAHENAIAAASAKRIAADRRLAEAEAARNLAFAARCEAWSLWHAAETTRDNAAGTLRLQLNALAAECTGEADFALARLDNLLSQSLFFDVRPGERKQDGSVPLIHLSNKSEVKPLRDEIARARKRISEMVYEGTPFAHVREECRGMLADLRKKIVAVLPNQVGEVGRILAQ